MKKVSMITIKLKGGLANQMFQYALGRYLSLKLKVPLYLDLVHYREEQTYEKTIRAFALDVFDIKAEIASAEQIKYSKGWFSNPIHRKFNILINKFIPYYRVNTINELYPSFDSNILKVPANCYLNGFWQSEKYFNTIRDVILEDFTFLVRPSGPNEFTSKEIRSCNSVSLHIRRGDYVNSKHYQNVHEVLTVDYYNNAIELMAKYVENPVFFVFSDDTNWAKEHIKPIFNTKYIDYNNEKMAYEDLRLMSNCKHNIIANSTFSWWGAWLNRNPDKVVIAPKKWYKMDSLENKDITPQGWIRVENN